MNFPDVERVEGGGDVTRVAERLVEISHGIHVVVVVAHRVEEGDILEIIVRRCKVIGETVTVGIPVKVPCHVAERKTVGCAGRVRNRCVQSVRHLVELTDVVVAVGEVHVSQDKHGEVVVVHFPEFEIPAVDGVHIVVHGLVELGKYAVAGHFIAAGDYDENITPLLLGAHLIDAVLIGFDYEVSVRYQHSRYSHTVALHDSIDIGVGIRFDLKGSYDHKIEGSCIIVCSIRLHIQFVITGHSAFRNGKCEMVSVLEIAYGAGDVFSRSIPKHYPVVFGDVRGASQLQCNILPFFNFDGRRYCDVGGYNFDGFLLRLLATSEDNGCCKNQNKKSFQCHILSVYEYKCK